MLGFTMAAGMRDEVPETRKRVLLEIVEQNGHVSVAEAVERFGVSRDTIRRDLDQLDEAGLVARTHGGAMRIETAPPSPLFIRTTSHRKEKARIGQAAASLIADGQTLVMNGGSTVLATAAALGDRSGLTVVTNNLLVSGVVPKASVSDIYVIGGAIRLDSQVSIGPLVLLGSEGEHLSISADLAVIGVGGVSERGFSAMNVAEARMMRSMMERANRVIVVCDASKFERTVLTVVGRLDVAHVLVTDTPPPTALARALTKAGTEILVAE